MKKKAKQMLDNLLGKTEDNFSVKAYKIVNDLFKSAWVSDYPPYEPRGSGTAKENRSRGQRDSWVERKKEQAIQTGSFQFRKHLKEKHPGTLNEGTHADFVLNARNRRWQPEGLVPDCEECQRIWHNATNPVTTPARQRSPKKQMSAETNESPKVSEPSSGEINNTAYKLINDLLNKTAKKK